VIGGKPPPSNAPFSQNFELTNLFIIVERSNTYSSGDENPCRSLGKRIASYIIDKLFTYGIRSQERAGGMLDLLCKKAQGHSGETLEKY